MSDLRPTLHWSEFRESASGMSYAGVTAAGMEFLLEVRPPIGPREVFSWRVSHGGLALCSGSGPAWVEPCDYDRPDVDEGMAAQRAAEVGLVAMLNLAVQTLCSSLRVDIRAEVGWKQPTVPISLDLKNP